MSRAARFSAAWVALYAAHAFGDHWIQTERQALAKQGTGDDTAAGRAACARHVATLTATKAAALAVTAKATGLRLRPGRTLAALALDALSHYALDRGFPRLADAVGKGGFYRLGDKKAAPVGHGAYALDQSAHIAALWLAALLISSAPAKE